jgi:transposase
MTCRATQLFEAIDALALAPLPAEPYEYAEWKKARVAPDYHIEVHGHFYSVPSSLIRQTVEARVGEATVEVFHKGRRVAAHLRSRVHHRHTTVPEHMPSAHRVKRQIVLRDKATRRFTSLCRVHSLV